MTLSLQTYLTAELWCGRRQSFPYNNPAEFPFLTRSPLKVTVPPVDSRSVSARCVQSVPLWVCGLLCSLLCSRSDARRDGAAFITRAWKLHCQPIIFRVLASLSLSWNSSHPTRTNFPKMWNILSSGFPAFSPFNHFDYFNPLTHTQCRYYQEMKEELFPLTNCKTSIKALLSWEWFSPQALPAASTPYTRCACVRGDCGSGHIFFNWMVEAGFFCPHGFSGKTLDPKLPPVGVLGEYERSDSTSEIWCSFHFSRFNTDYWATLQEIKTFAPLCVKKAITDALQTHPSPHWAPKPMPSWLAKHTWLPSSVAKSHT